MHRERENARTEFLTPADHSYIPRILHTLPCPGLQLQMLWGNPKCQKSVPPEKPRKGNRTTSHFFFLVNSLMNRCVLSEKRSERPIHTSVILMFLSNESFETGSSVYLGRTMPALFTMKGVYAMRWDVEKFSSEQMYKRVLQPGSSCSFKISPWLGSTSSEKSGNLRRPKLNKE